MDGFAFLEELGNRPDWHDFDRDPDGSISAPRNAIAGA